MRIAKPVFRILFILLLIWILTRTYENRHQEFYGADQRFIYSHGSAPEEVRSEIIQQLRAFQNGYTQRDTSLLRSYMDQLFSRDNTLILGTMPQEIYRGFDATSSLVRADWDAWGDCHFLVDNAHVSSHGDVAWFSTIGYVNSDLSRFLDMPLRLSGVLVHESGGWKFQHLQFQFDVDLSMTIAVILLLMAWLIITVLALIVSLATRWRRARVST
jgi:hypothetical protein